MSRIPVYIDLGGVHQIVIFEEMDDGTFRRTSEQPMRLLKENILGIGPVQGELVSSQFDREDRCWHSPTIVFKRRPLSYYRFFREQIKQRKIYVFTKASLSGRLSRFDLHELQLKPTASRQVQSLLTRKLVEAVILDLHHEESVVEQENIANIVA